MSDQERPEVATMRTIVATCRICGCTDERACEGGCSWIQDPQQVGDLCSSCLPFVRAVLDVVRADLRLIIDALLRDQFDSGHLGDTLTNLLETWYVR